NPAIYANISSTDALSIGGNDAFGRWFAGQIGDVAIYDHALTSGQIAEHFRAGGTPLPAAGVLLLPALSALGLIAQRQRTSKRGRSAAGMGLATAKRQLEGCSSS